MVICVDFFVMLRAFSALLARCHRKKRQKVDEIFLLLFFMEKGLSKYVKQQSLLRYETATKLL